MMPTMYGVTPHVEHFKAMIHLYCRAGFINKAKQMLLHMPFKPTLWMLITLVKSCWAYGDTMVGEWAGDMLLEMKPLHSRYYKLIAKIYRAARSWVKLRDLQDLMRSLGVLDQPW